MTNDEKEFQKLKEDCGEWLPAILAFFERFYRSWLKAAHSGCQDCAIALEDASMNTKARTDIVISAFIMMSLVSSCSGLTGTSRTSPRQTSQRSAEAAPSTSTIPPSFNPTVPATPSSTPDICRFEDWREDGLFVLSTLQFHAYHPGGPAAIDRILISQNADWAGFRQEDHQELRSAGVIFHERSFGPEMGMGANPAIVLVTYGVDEDWELPEDGDLASRVEQIRDSLYQDEAEWEFGELDHSLYPPIVNGATYALFQYFDGDIHQLETWCRTYVDVYGESPLQEGD